MKNLGGNTPSEEDCTVLTIGTEEEEGFTKPLDSLHTREGGMYRQGEAFEDGDFASGALGRPGEVRLKLFPKRDDLPPGRTKWTGPLGIGERPRCWRSRGCREALED